MAFDVEGARKAGYSDAEIADHLARSQRFDAAGARKSGYNDADLIEHLNKQVSTKQQAKTARPAKPDLLTKATGFMANVNRGLGIGDEIAGGVTGLFRAGEAIGRGRPDQIGNAFQSAMRDQRGREDEFQASNPRMAALGRGIGNAPTVFVPVGQGANALVAGSRVGNMVRGAVAAGGAGAVYAAADRGTAGERLRTASQTAVNPLVLGLGAAAGALAPTAARAPQTKQAKVEARAGKRMGLDPVAARQRAAEMRAAGVEPTLIDVAGERGRRVVRAIGVKSEIGGEALADNARVVSASTKPAAMIATRRLTPDKRTAAQFADDMTATRTTTADANYGAFSDELVTFPREVAETLMDAPGRAIVARARADAVERQDWGRVVELDKILRAADDGQPLPRVSAGTIDKLVSAARERGATLQRRGNNTRAGGSFGRASQIDSVIDNVDAVKPARQTFANQSRAIDIAKGKDRLDAFSTDPADYTKWVRSLPKEAQEANRIAIRQEILDTLGGQRSSSFGTLDELATSPYVRENLRSALGAKAADRYIAEISARLQKTRNATFVSPNAGSRTAVLENDAAEVAKSAVDFGKSAMRGDAVGILEKAMDAYLRRGFKEDEAAALARAAVDPAQLDRFLGMIAQRQGGAQADKVARAVVSSPSVPDQIRAAASARLSRAVGAVGGTSRVPTVEVTVEGRPDLYGASYGRAGQ
jgi:hypothetical protein